MELSGQHHAPAALPQGNNPWYPLFKRLVGAQVQSGRYRKEKNLLFLPGNESLLIGRCTD
jgi:hypothetical protein